mmetsp:Transcript_7894/g.20300  ORF Transcript_7894/g.20300 Transcript_7894/m.20300 type:complete len:351 (+) Transcript_7894:392-1444(+)
MSSMLYAAVSTSCRLSAPTGAGVAPMPLIHMTVPWTTDGERREGVEHVRRMYWRRTVSAASRLTTQSPRAGLRSWTTPKRSSLSDADTSPVSVRTLSSRRRCLERRCQAVAAWPLLCREGSLASRAREFHFAWVRPPSSPVLAALEEDSSRPWGCWSAPASMAMSSFTSVTQGWATAAQVVPCSSPKTASRSQLGEPRRSAWMQRSCRAYSWMSGWLEAFRAARRLLSGLLPPCRSKSTLSVKITSTSMMRHSQANVRSNAPMRRTSSGPSPETGGKLAGSACCSAATTRTAVTLVRAAEAAADGMRCFTRKMRRRWMKGKDSTSRPLTINARLCTRPRAAPVAALYLKA